MALPTFYHSNILPLGTLSGSQDSVTNPVGRVADGDIGLVYVFTTGDPPVGAVQVTVSGAVLPVALVIARATQVSGYRLIVESEDVGGGNNAVRVDELLDDISNAVYLISGSAIPREVWRITLSGVSGLAAAKVYEMQLAYEFQFAIPPQVGVDRLRIRQMTRIEIPGGQAFTQKLGPVLLQNTYDYVATSGDEISELEAFVESIDDGASVFHVDDRGAQYWAEVFAKDFALDDQAGVYFASVTTREVRVNGQEDEPR